MDNTIIEPSEPVIIKRGRKPKQPKANLEVHNNIDSITFDSINTQETEEPIPELVKKQKPKTIVKSSKKSKIVKPEITFNNILEDNQLITNIENPDTLGIPEKSTSPSNSNLIIPVNLDYKTPISHIYHISDLHIQLYKRHNEYQTVFNKVYDYLRNEMKNNISYTNTQSPCIVVLTGDILHSKSDLSPECIQMTYTFLKTLSGIMPVVLIPGNHDININNRDRLDALTPIIADLPATNPIYYLLESGVYQMNNILFYHASIFDYKIISPSQVQTPIHSGISKLSHKLSHIMLYHGRVNGAVLFNGMTFNDISHTHIATHSGISSTQNKTITPSTFEPYDMALLGDIHKHQFLAPNIAYAGSLIQQNMGEDIANHGLIKWDIKTSRGELVQIPNEWSYTTMLIENKRANYLCTMPNGEHNPECQLSKNLRVRILYKNTPESYLSDYITLLKMNHNVFEYAWQNDDASISLIDTSNTSATSSSSITTNTSSSVNALTSLNAPMQSNSLIDITSPEIQNRYILEYLQQNEPTITQPEIDEVCKMNISQNTVLKEANKGYNNVAFNGHYKIKRLEFSNLFSFGGNNVIDFNDFKGIVGIIAANHLGKSSIIDIIIYTLFDEFTRKGSTKDIININKDDFHIKMEIGIGQWTYTIIKTGYRTKVGASVKVEFYRVHDVNKTIERLEEDNASKTKERIAEYFGYYEDIIHTSFSIQHDNSCFIDSSNIKRKEELERIMRFEIVKKLYEMANQKYNKDKAVYEHIKKKIKNDDIVEIKKAKTQSVKLLTIITADKDYAKVKIKQLHETILETSKTLHTECNEFMEDNDETATLETIADIKHDIENNANKLSKLRDELIVYLEKDVLSVLDKNIIRDEKNRLSIEDAKYIDVVKDANKKIKIIDQTVEKLYKSRKPCNIKIPSSQQHQSQSQSQSQSQYLEMLKEKHIAMNDDILKQIDDVVNEINVLKEKEKKIEINNDKILELEKQMVKLPEELISFLPTESIDDLQENYDILLEELLLDINEYYNDYYSMYNNDSNRHRSQYQHINLIKELPSYLSYCDYAKKYFLKLGLTSAISATTLSTTTTTTPTISEQQSQLESFNMKLKQEIKQIKPLEQQINQLENKKISNQNQINLILADIDNLVGNNKIDEDIKQNKEKRHKYETRIEDTENKLSQNKTFYNLLNQYESTLLSHQSLQLDLEEQNLIISKFETYRQQIEENKPILEYISKLKEELKDFEEVLTLIEEQYTQEQANIIKYSALLEQIKRDLQEGREIERKMRISELYRSALKQLPYILLSKIQPILEKKVNDLLSITTDFTVRFDMSDSKIDIYLDRSIYKDKSRNIIINNASGFERFMASLAIRMALLELSNLPKINFMAIDEGWSSFDTHNINNVSVILDYLTSKFDFVLTISHLIQIKEHCDIQLSLKKDDYGFSKIVY